MYLNARSRESGDDVKERVCDFKRIAERHAFVFGSGREEALAH